MNRLLVLGAISALACTSPNSTPADGSGAAVTEAADERPLAKEVSFTRESGGSVVTTLSPSIRLNSGSSLQREWLTAHDTRLPVDIKGTVGIRTVYVPSDRYSRGEYAYRSSFTIQPRDSLAAVEVRFILFDVWGEHTKTLRSVDVVDIPAGRERTFTPEWNLYSENEASHFYASIAYVSRVRTKSGRVFEADYDPIVAEARKIYARFAPADLDPTRRTAPDSATAR